MRHKAVPEAPPKRKCDHAHCRAEAQYPAPKSRDRLEDYYWFCLKHIRAYNKSWNYYDNMDAGEIAQDQYRDLLGNRPAWRISANPMFHQKPHTHTASPHPRRLPLKIKSALQKMQLELPVTLRELKNHYKTLVKSLHPDIHGDNPGNENRLKEINSAYRLLTLWLRRGTSRMS